MPEELERETVQLERLVGKIGDERFEAERRLARPARPTRAAAVDGHRKLVEPIGVVGQHERGLHVGRDFDCDVGARQSELHVQRKALADTEVFGRQAEVRQLPAATRRSIVPNDVRILDLDGADPEIEIGGRSAAVRSRRVAGRSRRAAEILPIVGAAAIAREIELEPRQARLADLDSLREQRQQGEAQLGAADARHRLVAEARRVAQGGSADRNANRREQRELEVAVQRELPARRVLHGRGDLALVVVRVEQQADRDGHDDEQQDDDTDGNAEES